MVGKTNVGGGGLNFKIVGGTSQPTNPQENTIWVNTSTAITSYVFSSSQPTGAAGMVWFSTGSSSNVAFSATKKNPIMLYPSQCFQFVSGQWVQKTAKTYLNGAWVDWRTWYFESGGSYKSLWSGWDQSGSAFSIENQSMVMQSTASNNQTRAVFTDPIDLTNISVLVFDIQCTENLTNVKCGVSTDAVIDWHTPTGTFNNPSSTSRGEVSVDISSFSGSGRIVVWAGYQNGQETIYNVYGQ